MPNHKDIMKGAAKQFKPLFDISEQAMYIYMSDTEKACNKKFSDLLGYSSPEEWAAVKANFPSVFVADNSTKTLISAYQRAMEKGVGNTFEAAWKKKKGGTVNTKVILVPIAYENHLMALHFVTPL